MFILEANAYSASCSGFQHIISAKNAARLGGSSSTPLEAFPDFQVYKAFVRRERNRVRDRIEERIDFSRSRLMVGDDVGPVVAWQIRACSIPLPHTTSKNFLVYIVWLEGDAPSEPCLRISFEAPTERRPPYAGKFFQLVSLLLKTRDQSLEQAEGQFHIQKKSLRKRRDSVYPLWGTYTTSENYPA